MAIRGAFVAALVAAGGLVCWALFLVEQHLSAPIATPVARDVTFDVVVSDADTGMAVSGAEVGVDAETGEYDPPGPTWKGITDAAGRFRLVQGFDANTVLGKDGKVRGVVVFHFGTPLTGFSHLLAIRAAGYREQTVRLEGIFPLGIAYEDPSPKTIRVRLAPSPPR